LHSRHSEALIAFGSHLFTLIHNHSHLTHRLELQEITQFYPQLQAEMRKIPMKTARFSPITLSVCVSSMFLLGVANHVSAKMMRTSAPAENFAQSRLSDLDDGKPAKETSDPMKLAPAARHSRQLSGSRHHHHPGVVSSDPAPQVAQVPDGGTSVVLLTIALASLTAFWSFRLYQIKRLSAASSTSV